MRAELAKQGTLWAAAPLLMFRTEDAFENFKPPTLTSSNFSAKFLWRFPPKPFSLFYFLFFPLHFSQTTIMP